MVIVYIIDVEIDELDCINNVLVGVIGFGDVKIIVLIEFVFYCVFNKVSCWIKLVWFLFNVVCYMLV